MLKKVSQLLGFLIIFLPLLAFFCFIPPVAADDTAADDSVIADLNRQIDEQRQKVDQLADEIAKYQNNIKTAQGKATTLQNQIYVLDNQIAKSDIDIQAKEEEIKAVELEIKKIGLEIQTKELEIEKNKTELAAFIRILYQYDQRNYISVLLSHSSFSEFFDQLKYLQNVEGDLQKTLNRVQEIVAKLNQDKNDLDGKREEQSDLLKKLEDEKYVLAGQKQSKNYLITETKKSEKKFQTLVTDLKKEQAAASAAVAALEKKLRAELTKRGEGEKFNALGDAVLAWPTSSHRLTCYFHDPEYPYRYLFEHSGIDIGVGEGTPVYAAEAGYVAKVALGTKWYGNYIMIIHSDNLATLYAHLSSVSVSADQYVSKGQTIGLSGNTGFSSGPHLHFEVRSNGVPVDPMGYLP